MESVSTSDKEKKILQYQKELSKLESQLNSAIVKAKQKSDQEYLKKQLSDIEDKQRRLEKKALQYGTRNGSSGASSSDENDSSNSSEDESEAYSSENNSENGESENEAEAGSIHEEEDVGTKPSEDKNGSSPTKTEKKRICLFDISKPNIADTEGLVGLNDEKTFMLATIKGPKEFPLHQSKMRAKSRLKSFMLFGCPGKQNNDSKTYLSTYLQIWALTYPLL